MCAFGHGAVKVPTRNTPPFSHTGVSFCISVSSVPLDADLSVSAVGTLVGKLNEAATTDTLQATALKADPATGTLVKPYTTHCGSAFGLHCTAVVLAVL